MEKRREKEAAQGKGERAVEGAGEERACATSPFESELQESALSTPESSYVSLVPTVSL